MPTIAPTSRPPAVTIMQNLGLKPDPWQVQVLESAQQQILLNCCRQAGKSTVVAILGLVQAIFVPGTRVLLVSRSHRQSREVFRTVMDFYLRLDSPLEKRHTADELELDNLSRIVCLPCNEDTIRGYANVSLLVLDEAARVPDDVYRTVRPMLAVSNGRIICLSTPYGKRGFFWDAWSKGGDDWARIKIKAESVPRISPLFLQQERKALGESWYRQEYECSFEALEGLVFPDFNRRVVPAVPPHVAYVVNTPREKQTARWREEHGLKMVGGIDFGFRNPFAAVWGVLDRDGVLWLVGEHYGRQKPLSFHARHLPRHVTWYCDPSGANERAELQCAGFTVREGRNALRAGIAAVSARVENDTLRILEGKCPNLLAEAELYRYENDTETPLDENNHALAALRYLISRIDERKMARWFSWSSPVPTEESKAADEEAAKEEQSRKEAQRYREMIEDDRYWFPFCD